MPGARVGLVVYAKDIGRVAAFYAAVAGLDVLDDADGYVALASDALELVVVRIPDEIAETIEVATPPVRRTETPLKPVLPIADISTARERASGLGGVVDPPDREWRWGDTRVCDGNDPEGNVFQLREPSSGAAAGA